MVNKHKALEMAVDRVPEAIPLTIQVEEQSLSSMLYILQSGFIVKARPGCSLKNFLYKQIGLEPAYIAKRISIIFLDGKPVDNIESAIIQNDSTIALSGAMPGLAGAAMRRGSIYASFRNSITSKNERTISSLKEGMVHVKFFNMVMKELGPAFLKAGVFIKPSILGDLLLTRWDDLKKVSKKIFLNKKIMEPALMKECLFDLPGDVLFLSVNT